MEMVPDLRGLMREDAISVLVQHTLKPELPDARADVQAFPELRDPLAQSLPSGYDKINIL